MARVSITQQPESPTAPCLPKIVGMKEKREQGSRSSLTSPLMPLKPCTEEQGVPWDVPSTHVSEVDCPNLC